MSIYILLILFSLILLILRNSLIYRSLPLRNMIIVLTVLILFSLTVFRGITVGTDYPAYNSYYYSSSMALKMQYIENGYILLNSFARSLNLFIIIPAFEFIISFFGMYSLAVVNHCNRFSFVSMYILTYTYMQSFNALRQFIAIGFISFGCTFLFTNKKVKMLWFVFFVFLAYEFHSSALIMLIAPLLMRIVVTYTRVLWAGIITAGLFITGLGLKITQPLIMMNEHYATKYSDSMMFLTSAGNKGFIQFFPVIIQFLIFFFFLFFNRSISESFLDTKNVNIQYSYNFVFSGYLMFLLLYSAGGNGVIDRLQMFFLIFCIMANIYFIDNIKEKFYKSKFIFQIFVVIFWSVYCILRLLLNNASVVPYIFK